MINLIKDCLIKHTDRFSLTDARIGSLRFVLTIGYRKWLAFVFLENDREPSFVAKISDDEKVFDYVHNSYAVLSKIHQNASPFLKESVPYPVCLINDGGRLILMHTYLEGTPIALNGNTAGQNKNIGMAISWLTEFHKITKSRELSLDSPDGKRYLLDKIDSLKKNFELTASRNSFLKSVKDKILKLNSGKLPLVIQHNDFEHTNILIKDGSIRVIDWEYSVPEGLPLCDLFTIILKYWFLAGKKSAAQGSLKPTSMDYLKAFFSETGLSPVISEFTYHYCRELNIPEKMVELIFAVYILERKDAGLLDLLIENSGNLIFKAR